MSDSPPLMQALTGQSVVLDLASPFVAIGTLVGEDSQYFVLEQADMHDLRDSSTTRELYVLDCRRHGVGVNRQRVLIAKRDVVGISRLSDVRE